MTTPEPHEGIVLDAKVTLTLEEVCDVCGVGESVVIEMVREGIAEPLDTTATLLEFTGIAVTRLLAARRLQRDLQVNLAGAALALQLLDRISELERSDES